MTMIDDDTLAALFTQAADTFAVPESGRAEILARAFGPSPSAHGGNGAADGDDTATELKGHGEGDGADVAGRPVSLAAARARRLRLLAASHRVATVAACVVLALAIAGGASLIGRQQAPSSSVNALAHGASTPSTTLPGSDALKAAGAAGNSTTNAAPTQLAPTSGAQNSATGGASGSGVAGSAAPQSSAPSSAATAAPTSPSATGAQSFSSASGAPRIEQTGSLTLGVARGALTKTMSELTFLAATYGGFVSSSQTQSGALSISGTATGIITLQVPVANFSNLLKKAQSLGTTTALTTKADDVTSQVVNLAQRIAALQASEQQYLTIMAKATSIGDVLAVQTQLDSIESQIEQLQGQQNLLNSQTTYSTLTATVTEHGAGHHQAPRHHRSGLDVAWDNSVHGFVSGVEGLIRLAGPALFILLCGLALALGGRAGWRRYQRHSL